MMRDSARREDQSASKGHGQLVAKLKGQLALDLVEGFVEVVMVERRPGPRRRIISIAATWPPLSSLRR